MTLVREIIHLGDGMEHARHVLVYLDHFGCVEVATRDVDVRVSDVIPGFA